MSCRNHGGVEHFDALTLYAVRFEDTVGTLTLLHFSHNNTMTRSGLLIPYLLITDLTQRY